MVLLVTSDKEEVNVDNEVVECSMLLKTMLEGYREPVQPKIPLPDVSSKVLKKVTEYCKYYKNDACPAARNQNEPCRPTDIIECDQKSITADQDMLFEIILAAYHLQITSLFDFGCQTLVNRTKGKTPEELCNFFGIVNEFTAEAKEPSKQVQYVLNVDHDVTNSDCCTATIAATRSASELVPP